MHHSAEENLKTFGIIFLCVCYWYSVWSNLTWIRGVLRSRWAHAVVHACPAALVLQPDVCPAPRWHLLTTQPPRTRCHSHPCANRGSQTLQQETVPLAPRTFQRTPPRLGAHWAPDEEQDEEESRTAPTPRRLLRLWERQHLGGKQNQSYRHLRQQRHRLAWRHHQQLQEKAVLFWDDLQQRADRRFWVFGNRCAPLELILYQFAHVRASADFIQEPGGVETHKDQCSLCVCAEPKVLETMTNWLLLNTPAKALWYQTWYSKFLHGMVDILLVQTINDNLWH